MNRIKECRINAHLSQKYVAVTLGVAAPSVSNWESGKSRPTAENLKQLAKLFGVSVDYLLGGDQPLVSSEAVTEGTSTPKSKKEPTVSSGLNEELVQALMGLNEAEIQRVLDFVSGVRSRREGLSSQAPSDRR